MSDTYRIIRFNNGEYGLEKRMPSMYWSIVSYLLRFKTKDEAQDWIDQHTYTVVNND